jgi:peptidylprolyl isomerase
MRNATKILLVLAAVVSAGACVNSEQASTEPTGQPQYTAPRDTETEEAAESESPETPTSEAPAGPECTVDDIAVAGEPGTAPQVTLPTTCSPPTALLSKDLVVGTGPEAAAGSTMEANYHLVTWSNGEVADSSFESGQTLPLENVGATEGLIPGWNEGIVGMHQGGRRLLVIPPDKGYGEQGRQPKVGPNETLVFVIEAVTVTPPA